MNYREIVQEREVFLRGNPYEKTIHERNFKHWLMQVEHRVDADGFIQPAGEWAQAQWDEAPKVASEQQDTELIWQPIGPMETYNAGSEGGIPVSWQCNVYCFDQSPTNPNICVAGVEAGDLFKTVDQGLTWHAVTEGVPGIRTVRAVKIAPSDPNRIYFEANQTLYGTLDGGTTWNLLHNLGEHATQIAVHPSNPDEVFVSAWNGLHRTTDGGETWTTIFTGITWDVAYHPTNTSVLYALRYGAALNRCEMHRSDDGGATFSLKDDGYFVPSDPGNASADGGRLGVTPADPNRVYVALIGRGKAEDTGWIGLYQSLDQGESWSNLNGQDGAPYDPTLHPSVANGNLNGTGIYQGFYDFDLAVSHNDPNTAWVGVTALSATYDGGASWQRIGAYSASTYDIGWIHPDIQDLSVVGDHIWVATDGGLNYSSDELSTHESRKKGIYNSTFWGFGHGWNTDLQVGGRYHNGNTGFMSTYGSGNHLRLGGAESPTGYVHPLNGEGRQARFSDITDVVVPVALGGSSSAQANLGLYPNESYSDFRNSELVVDPRYGNRMVLGNGGKLYRSEDGGNVWQPWYDWGSSWAVYEIEQGMNDPGRWYVVTRSGGSCKLFRSTNDGASWGQLTSGLPGNWGSMEIALNPLDANDIWAIQAGGTAVYRSTTGGTGWMDETNALWSGESLREILPLGGRGVVLFSSKGVYFFDNSTETWTDASAGIPAFWAPLEGATHYATGTVRIADKGKGIWQADIPWDLEPLAQPMTASPEVYCANDTVAFDCHSVLNHNGTTWEWAFHPEPQYVSSSTSRRVEVVFGSGGPVDVTLTVTQADGSSDTRTVLGMVEVGDPAQCLPNGEAGDALNCGGAPQFGMTHDLGVVTNTYTAMAWVKPNGIQPDYTGIVLGGESAAGLNFRPNNELAYHWPGGAWWWSSGLTVPADEWSHVALVVSPTEVKVMLNGVEAVHSVSVQPVSMAAQWLGSYRGWTSRNFNGLVDEVKIWNRALTLDEVRQQRHLTLTVEQAQADPDFLGYYQFNEDASFLVNKKPFSNHGVFSGGATLTSSTAPVGSGESVTVSLPSSGVVETALGALEVESSTAPSGLEWRIHRLNNEPANAPETWSPHYGWWVVDTYPEAGSSEGNWTWTGSWTMWPLDASVPWSTPDVLAGVEVVQRNVNDDGLWSMGQDGVLASDPTALVWSGTRPVEGQWTWASDACFLDTTEVVLCPGESLIWQDELVDTAGDYWHHEELAQGCDVVELLTVENAQVPALSWTAQENGSSTTLQVDDSWDVQGWTLNGTALDGAVNNSLDVSLDGNYGVVAVHASTGCVATYEALLGCPGDVNGDLAVGVSDVLAYLSAFGCMSNCGMADLNGDGAANTSDLLMMLSLFGAVCN
ncbi:MAG: LamG-like jellyroll fold domain-containing protein [Flavobacteriales bacterium]